MNRKAFYKSKAWNETRKYIWIKQNCLCARCGRAVYVDGITEYVPKEYRLIGIVHHKQYLNDSNVYDDSIALDENNLEGVCIDCHNTEHMTTESTKDDVCFDEFGNLTPRLKRKW